MIAFIKKLKHILTLFNKENFITLFYAIKNESFFDVWNNSKNYFKNTLNGKNISHKNVPLFIKEVINKYKFASSAKEVMVFVSHEATITGAPLIILGLAKHLQKDYNILPVFFCLEGGDLINEFTTIAPTFIFRNSKNRTSLNNQTKQIIAHLKPSLNITKAIVNSAESIAILQSLKQLDITEIIFLLHETGSFYEKNAWMDINNFSKTIVFPSQFVKKHAIQNTEFNSEKIFVKGQGLLKPELLSLDKKSEKQKLRKLLNLPEDSIIVLGCGQLIARKGFDMFAFTAISVSNKLENIYFVWLGEAAYNDYQKWVNIDIDIAQKADRIIFTGQVEDTSIYFGGADLFFLSSRGDPFPCVVQEAMACQMPIIAFEDAGGVNELVDNSNGSILPYADIAAVANKIIELAQNKEIETLGFQSLKKICEQHSFEAYTKFVASFLDS